MYLWKHTFYSLKNLASSDTSFKLCSKGQQIPPGNLWSRRRNSLFILWFLINFSSELYYYEGSSWMREDFCYRWHSALSVKNPLDFSIIPWLYYILFSDNRRWKNEITEAVFKLYPDIGSMWFQLSLNKISN